MNYRQMMKAHLFDFAQAAFCLLPELMTRTRETGNSKTGGPRAIPGKPRIYFFVFGVMTIAGAGFDAPSTS
jgi:hypothetical protein